MDYSEFKEHFSILSDTGFAHVIDAPFYRILG